MRMFIALTAMNEVGASLKELSDSLKGLFDNPIKGFGVLSEYARRRASLVSNVGRSEKTSFTRLHPALKVKQELFEELTRDLASAVDRVLRKHGKNIIGKQLATRRLADIMIDLFVLACTMSRVSTDLGARSAVVAAKELEILDVLSGQVRRRVKATFAMIDDNDDEHIKSLADHALEAEGYTWDNL